VLHPAIAARIEIRSDDGAPALIPLLGGADKLGEMWECVLQKNFATPAPPQETATLSSQLGDGPTGVGLVARSAGVGVVEALLWSAAAAGVALVAWAPRDDLDNSMVAGILAAAASLRLVLWLLGCM